MTTPFDIDDFIAQLTQTAKQQAWSKHEDGTTSRDAAAWLDKNDALASLREQYLIPRMKDVCKEAAKLDGDEAASLYMCGNSLGPLTRRSRQYITEEVEAWQRKAVLGHWDHPFGRPWTRCEERVSYLMSDIVGAKPSEVVAMGTLTSNLHVMLATFYRPHIATSSVEQLIIGSTTTTPPPPQRRRHKIIYEALAFPSDQYALASTVALHGFDPQTSLVALRASDDQRTLRTEDVLAVIDREAATGELAMVLLGDVQYQTGQMFDVRVITAHARALGVLVGWDLAHAFANVPLALHDWDVDFAVWCTYKYGSSGPGGMAGLFVHERWAQRGFTTCIGRDGLARNGGGGGGAQGLPRPAGWWGHKKSTRFSMPDSFDAMPGAAGWQQSNPSALDMAALLGSLETMALAPGLVNPAFTTDLGSDEHVKRVNAITGNVGFGFIMPALRQKSQRLTAYLEHLLLTPGFLPRQASVSIVTPREARFRGSQLSIRIKDEQSNANSAAAAAPASNGTSTDHVPPPISSQSLVSRIHHTIETRYGVVADIRHPDVLRIAPVAQFSTFDDVWRTADALRKAFVTESGGKAAAA